MKKQIVFLVLLLVFFSTNAQQKKVSGLVPGTVSVLKKTTLPDSLFSTYYHQRVSHFRSLPLTKNDIVFLGNSITDGAEWSELFADNRIKNRGISGDISTGVLNRIDEISIRKPAKVFLLIGTNDLSRNTSTDSVFKNITKIASYLKQESPSTKLYVQSILPVNDVYKKFGGHTSKGEQIKQLNAKLKQNAAAFPYTYMDLHTPFCDQNGKLIKEFTNDGLHLKGEGYLMWKHLVYPYVFDLESKPSLLPKPQQLKWNNGFFPLTGVTTIVTDNPALAKEALVLKKAMEQKGLNVKLANEVSEATNYIQLRLGKVASLQNQSEAYHLETTANKIVLTANTPQGIYSGIQTLLQLMRDNVFVDAVEITDWPAFAWRGFMVDVGRNFQSVKLLKQQIDAMVAYKLNIFHFHPTEDIAWRLQSKLYPQLTNPEFMLRDKGEYYTERDLKELINYCKERYITLVPEIDMPGHSAAFKRAMGVDMQSDEGLEIVKNIIKEFCATYDVPYLHLGADEVKITNQKFLPEVIALTESLGKKVIGWEPGGNFSDGVIRQLWMEGATKVSKNKSIKYLDSRHLYLNHMDPLESVVTIFNRQICNLSEGNENALGAIVCVWNDRAVANEEDVMTMNPVYPGMLAFAERSWLGGGHAGWTATIGEPNSERAIAFAEFENRLLDQKKQYFKDLAFTYVKQADLVWDIYGPFDNKGDLTKIFAPEKPKFNPSKEKPLYKESGGTLVMRHWWAPLISGVIEQPKENTTWYAQTQIWSDEDKEQEFWIGFNNLSRSMNTDSPVAGTWNNLNSLIWVNNELVEPPLWERPNQKGNSEIPLIDEGYEFREPTKITLKKGWNEVRVKLPVGSFKGTNWQNPVKWMFTFVEVTE
ncbi:family 20 glycosylhydrolase [Flavobacterium acetivorans]|uniref:family 20 glycosylhydrolase n=1 Tax=Flavobacterium acetivorans TaxID=2893883 RepID=UPI001E3CE832|nr:family 20 glycosylhydrolase [Flavobacterium sp. F-29]UFH36891.1 family 20 glycosylhydrolase [Flavobacterium sp. F-29]